MADSDDDGFDLIQPSLIQQLRTILDQYPDDGQILKELIQNAEDANASEVKFLHDKHSYGAAHLFDEDLAQFQGPALYSYNNARFTTQDWRGIRLVCDSIKVEDPMKVGRFGLGFKSVFHMTDLPSLLSDFQIGFIDPHGVQFSDKYHRRTGKHWRLNEDRAEMEEIPDQFLPYIGIFDCTEDVFSQGFYDGTLFRFPFRTKPSKLSETLYSAEKMDTLFESFEADAHLILLFLQHLESIELYVREESQSDSERVFQVKIADKSLQIVRAKRKEFRAKITPGKLRTESATVTYPLTIETVRFDSLLGETVKQHSFLVTNYFCGAEVSTKFKRLMTDKQLNYLPTVGVAMALPTGPKQQTPDIKGHVFCFLPLPVQKKSLTGLPVHVNGFFALTQNRRYIKSPNADQEDREMIGRQLTDRSLLWNRCLLEEAIPRAYATMILEAINGKSFSVSRTSIYKAWPDISCIDQKWEKLKDPLFQLLLQERVIYTRAHFGQWLTVGKAVFDLLSEHEPKELLQQVLLAADVCVVSVPSHVTNAITCYSTVNNITPSLTRAALKRVPSCYMKLDRREKFLLLQFCLKDRKFHRLCDLTLLPLSNGAFKTFSKQGEQIYICSPEHPQELFPGLEQRFLDGTINVEIVEKLKEAAGQEVTQLRLLGGEDVPTLLQQALPSEWNTGNTVAWYPDDSNHNHPPRDWVKVVWRYLQEHFIRATDILSLGALPLIPLNLAETPVTLTRLCHPSKVVVRLLNDDCLDDTLTNVLVKLGLIVMNDYPTFLSHHSAVLGTFVNPPTTQGVLHAMVVSSNQMTAGTFSEIVRNVLSTNDKHLLRSLLANAKRIGPAEYNVLCSLPVFETLSKKFVSKDEGLCAAPDETLPVAPLQELIDVTQQNSKALARILNVKILKPTELLCQMVFPDILRGRYSGEQIDKLMAYVLDRHASDIRRNPTLKRHLEDLSFVSKQRGRAKASELFDPKNKILRRIFAKENVFPIAGYTKTSVLAMLEELGMKSDCDITGHDLYQSANLVSSLTHLTDLPTAEQKSKAILQFLSDNPEKLLEKVNRQPLGVLLRDIPWVSRLQERPHNYPPGLAWWETDEEEVKCFFKPTEVKSHHIANLIGTVMPVVEMETSNQISRYFGWQNQPNVFQVVQHLQTVIRSYSKEEKPFYMVVINEIYLFLSRAKDVDVDRAFDCFEEFDWVWNGDGFSSPHRVLSRTPHIDLTPYIRSLPSDMMKYSGLFFRFGMREQIDPAVLVQVLNIIKDKYDNESLFLFSPLGAKHDLQLSVNILNELANERLSDELQAQIVLPTLIKTDSFVRLEPVERCMYCEREWLKREGNDEDIEYFYVHPNVPNSTAERLGVPTLTSRMLDADELSIGEEFGQEERLTTRLNRLLEEYTDGFSVLKELVQNADDAGATEVRFLYDERTNEDAMTCLIDEGMKGCQGPALWVYNDAEFKDEDFENIAKLNEATKEHDTEKIGRFGLGFNAVYNLTDVPMFISRNYFAIFDPHTTYLGKAIRNKRKPGMKIDLNKDVKRLRKFTNQFKPFDGIFGCDMHLDKEDNSFDGTLFRFPLRTSEQASRSEIKRLAYNDQQMRELLLMLVNGAKTLLLFTQNVIHVSIFSLDTSGSEDQNATLVFQVSKSLSQAGIVRKLSVPVSLPATTKKLTAEDQDFLKQCNFLQASSQVTRAFRKGASTKPIKSSMKVDIKCSFTEYGQRFFASDLPFNQECSTWLVVSSMGDGQALHFAKNDLSLLPSAGVAVQLVQNGSDNCLPLPVVKSVDGYFFNGILFCYLPLPIHSGLPVHVNGAFALAANRRHLQEKLVDDKKCYGVDWNNVLMHDSISSAYLCLLEDLRSIAPSDGRYKFHSLWPKANEVHRNCIPLMKSFYAQIARGSYSLFSDGRKWVDINQVVFLDPDFRNEPIVGDISLTVFQMLMKGSAVVIDVPVDVLKSFQICGLGEVLKRKIYNKDRFFHDLFFPKISTLPQELRDALVLHALDTNCEDLIRNHACLPASPFGTTLKYPFQLIHPDKDAAQLFLPEDGRFPFGTKKSFLDSQRLAKLETLGMLSDDLPWQEIAERAESIQELNATNSDAAFQRVKSLLQFMDKKMKKKDEKCLNDATRRRILEAKFLPVLKKPNAFPLPWKGDEFGSKVLHAPEDVFLEEEKDLLCCTEPLVGVYITRDVKALLELNKKHATLDHVISQLDVAMSTKVESSELTAFDEINFLCNAAYSYLQKALVNNARAVKELLQGKKCILAGTEFLCANQMAFRLTTDCAPYLYKLPEALAVAFPKLMKVAGVRENFEEEDFILSLRQMKNLFPENELDEQSLQVAVHLADQLGETLRASGVGRSELQGKWGTVYLPDSREVMRPVSELCIKDCPWMPDEPDVHFVNTRISWPTCDQIGVKTRREEALRYHAVGIPFGQREKLTNRLKRILTGYPCEKEILKELLQNADDAQATEICFIKDPRHHPDQKVFEDKWQPLQGPALCVYNNKPFTNADIEGIQNLGEGSKGDDPNKTGQYGVGFNAVYHLTDVPSFISKGEEIGDVLCVFDPHCNYVPGASAQKPGCMFKDASTLRRKFPDVFPCYLVDHFSIDNATMFRFPLRTENMARESKISPKAVSVGELDVMMAELKTELFEDLLFVNNVKKITLCEVNNSGNLVNAYTVEAALSKEDEANRKAFSEYTKQIGKQAREGGVVVPTEVPVAKVSYVLNITDTLGNQEKWLIVQQIGFEKSVKTSIVNAFKEHQLGMLPRGGVASLLEKSDPRHPVQRGKKIYCFLPLPFETNLPVHVNGHFALDHEARRNLWRDEAGGYRTDWNNALFRDVVASCYLTLLVEVRNFLHLPIRQDVNPGTENEILQNINVYETFFPRQPPTDHNLKTLVDSVYQEIDRKELQILPVVRNRPLDAQKSTTVVEVTWLPPTGSGKYQALFNNLAVTGPFAMSLQKETDENKAKVRTMFESILLESGYNLVAFSLALHESFQRAGVTTSTISPSSVIDFLLTFSSQDPRCTIGPVPCGVHETSLKDAIGVTVVLLYCKGDASFPEKLPGLPLLLTQDNRLQLFSSRQPKFISRYHDILPGSPHVFLHEQIHRKIFSDTATVNSSVLKPLDAKAFAVHLPGTLSWERYGSDEFVQWSPNQKATPNQRWIFRVWVFLHELIRDVLDDVKMDEQTKNLRIKTSLEPLSNWSILPATEAESFSTSKTPPPLEHFLVPFGKATAVLDFKNADSSSIKLVDALRKLGLPELNSAALSSTVSGTSAYYSPNSVVLARMIVSSLKVPTSLLSSLNQKIELDTQSLKGRLEPQDCRTILEYFSKSVSCLRDANRTTLRRLPFYQATHGGLIRLDDRGVCVLPIGIPQMEMDVLERELCVVFLESWQSLSELFKFLALECVSAVDVYCNFILTHFSILSKEARQVHLEYIRKSILADPLTSDGDKQRLLECLTITPLIPSSDGTLKTASCFYDPQIEVFLTMLSESMFPSKPLNSPEWLMFLRSIGLVHKVTKDHFKRFATDVAHEAASAPNENTCKKSKVLVNHLIHRHNVVAEGLLQSICDIPFVAGDPVRETLQAICLPFRGVVGHQIPFFAFKGAVPSDHAEIVWTKAHLLPSRANPRCRVRELNRPPLVSIEQYCNAFVTQLQIAEKPSIDLVVAHCQNICLQLASKSEKLATLTEKCHTIMAINERVYTFSLTKLIANTDAEKTLENTPFMLVEHVLTQLNVAMSTEVGLLEGTIYNEISSLCNTAYSYLQKALGKNAAAVKQLLNGKKFILVGKTFLFASQVAFQLNTDCSPYLHKLPDPLAVAFPKLMEVACVRRHFEEKDYVSSLQKMKSLFFETQLDETNLQVAVHLAAQLGETLAASGVDPIEVQEKWGTVYLPDSGGVMRPVPELCIRDCPWMPDEPDVHFVNDKIPWPTCHHVGVKTRRQEALRDNIVGIPFGQRVNLTNRLKQILTCYPCEKEILKELLQNADDAQATEICFIIDPRHHPDVKVFEDKWQPLQGPALCVYNNKPFTNADIEGIRNFGEGSKGDDPNKTGQYGVGFNAAYHLTDAPSFVSKGEEIGDVLCVFDPLCKFAPGASAQEPGRMFKVNRNLQTRFPDVFPCYLEKHFPRDNATMFRFPLRTEKMARESKISSSPVSLREVETMMEDLKKGLFEVLLFVNNVKKITLCEVNGTDGNLVNAYTVEAAMSKEDEFKRQAFADYIKKIGKLVKDGREVLPTDIRVAKVSYVLNVTDTLRNYEKWLIVQQIGFEKSVKTSIVNAFKEHELGMLPRGGVACLLEKRDPRLSVQRRKKAYCFLPLPFETNLPVHVNGHFALDHEARRNLWRDEAGGYRTDWNNALLRDVVASCYITLLVEVRNFLKLPIRQDANSGTENEILQNINVYETFFPRQSPMDNYWKTLVDSVYQEIDRKELQILPVVRNRPLDAQKSTTEVEVSWFPPTGSGKYQAFFNNLAVTGPFAMSPQKEADEKQAKVRTMFESILLESGYNLVAFSLALHESFQRAGVTTSSISPSSVMDFFRTFSSQDPLCRIGPIPCSVNETTLKDALGVIVVLLYCKGDASFLDKQPGLPLLLTQDNCLQLFSSTQPKFISRYHDILPGSPHIFLHEQVHRKIFSDTATLNSSVLKPLDAKAFAVNLHQTLSWGRYGNDEFVAWSPNQKATPNQGWIFRVWVFLHELIRNVLDDVKMDDQTKELHIKTALEPLSNWSILPATVSKLTERKTSLISFFPSNTSPLVGNFLVPVGQATSVLDFRNADSSSLKLVGALQKLGLPELNFAALSTTGSNTSAYSLPNSVSLARMIVSSLKVPASLLTSLYQKMKSDPQSLKGRLEPQDCRTILEYFSINVSCLRDADRTTLRRLPFYQAAHGGLISLDDRRVCVLPIGIPRMEMDVLERELCVVFLETWQSLSELFKFFALECVSAVDLYCTFILPNLSILSKEARQIHLEYIRKSILEDPLTSDGDKQRLLECLTATPFVSSADGTLKTASCFYDPQIEVFLTMLSESMFPSKPLNSPEWLMFLRSIGLVHKVTKDHFKRFATDVAHEAASAPNENTCKKSKVLVNHLIHRHNVVAEGLLQSICDIPFVAGDPVRETLQAICLPFRGVVGHQIPFFAFKGAVPSGHAEIVWTKAHLLPRWANPRCRVRELNRPPLVSIDQYYNAFVTKLQIVEKPSIDLVVAHCQNICLQLASNSEKPGTLTEQCHTIMAVMERIYTFLLTKPIANSNAKKTLVNTPCILVEHGTKLILPCQAVLELYEHLEIKPFLYRIPREFGKFHPLFENFGCSKSVTICHYAMVLDMLQKRCQDSKLEPNEVTICVKAAKGFFERIEEDVKEVKNLSGLYLPGLSLRQSSSEGIRMVTPLFLHKSSDLIFNDAHPTFRKRLHNFNQLFLLDLREMYVTCSSAKTNYKDLIMKLPSALQPKMLSSVVKEKLSTSQTVEAVSTKVVTQLKHQLSSAQFCSGVIRLIRDENSRQERDVDDGVIENIERGLRRVELCAVKSLKTTLVSDEVPISGSEADVQYFLHKVLVSGEEIWRVYLNVLTGMNESTSVMWLVSNVIEEICGGLLGSKTVFILEMLRCPLNDIWSLLDDMGVRQDDSYRAAKEELYPEPGSFIPLEDHHLLNYAFEEFEPGEYVGYELEDPSLLRQEGNATYIYAVIIEKVMNEGSNSLAKRYRIDIGDGQELVVDAADLYKFHRLNVTTSSAIVSSDQPREAPRHRSREKVFDEISDQLEDAWKLPEEKRRKIIKRLYLRWHPDKNLGDEEFCNGVCHLIQNETCRLERGEQRGSQSSAAEARSWGGSYDDFFTSWGGRAREHHAQRQGYHTRQQSPRTSYRKNPQPGEARRWFKQAKADVAAVENDIVYSKPSYEWACFKCHQAAEKALKAAQYTIDADKTSAHNLVENCNSLGDSELTELALQLENLVGDSTRMRYPDRMRFPQIPNEVYSAQMAQQALKLAKKIVERVQHRIT